jgi:hypothetical protein
MEDDGVWEPGRFEVGQRVRIRISAECPWSERAKTHDIRLDGVVGTIDHRPSYENDHHGWGVKLDAVPRWWKRRGRPTWVVGFYAASELIPLD